MITIRGARTHNLKNLSLDLPEGRLIVITGVSGSGKSSLAFDTLYAEAQRRYLEALSLTARQWLDLLPRAEVDWISGLRPAVAISQHTVYAAQRSTVGTMSEVTEALRLLFARLGTPHCPNHPEVALEVQPLAAIRERIATAFAGERVALLVPHDALAEPLRTVEALRAAGYTRLWFEGSFRDLDTLYGPLPEEAALTIDRLRIAPEQATRLTDSLEHALTVGQGTVVVLGIDRAATERFSTQPSCPICAFRAPTLEPRHLSFNHPAGACPTCDGLGEIRPDSSRKGAENGEDRSLACPACAGTRLNPLARAVRFDGRTLPEVEALPLAVLADVVTGWQRQWGEHPVARPILLLIGERLAQMVALGLGYLALSRSSRTLSMGERQRVRLASQLANPLAGLLYLLDEPSAGLHPRDTDRLIAALTRLRDAGNTVVVVDHDALLMRAADHLVEIGPGAGAAGGELVYQGDFVGLAAALTPTGRYLRQPLDLTASARAVAATTPALWHVGATVHTLKGDPVCYPIGHLVAVTGVSGAGKSSLLFHALLPLVRTQLNRAGEGDPRWGQLRIGTVAEESDQPAGSKALPWHRVLVIDQSPIGTSPRSTPATYTGVMDLLRELFAQTPEARKRGYTAARFSYNLRGGRCEVCQGEGWRRVQMQFLPPVSEPCPSCHGARFNRETLEIRYRGLNLAEVLQLSVNEARPYFDAHPAIARILRVLDDLGLGYLPLGQPAPTLSGGEAQRLRLAAELAKPTHRPTLFLLDEPTTGLHFADIERLLLILFNLRDAGHTVIAAEHDPDFLRHADWVIELGPEGGPAGGYCCWQGAGH